jgi:hypothetical protein
MTGSSTVTESMIPHCIANESCELVYYYFAFNETERQSAINFLRSIIAQLLVTLPAVPKFLMQDLHKLCRDGKSVVGESISVLMDILRSLVALIKEIYIIINALDESQSQDGQLEQICLTLSGLERFPNLRILVTSRRGLAIE